MSKFRNRLMKRVMAVILSGAMVMSSMTMPGATAYASESNYDINEEQSEAFSQDDEISAEETDNKTAENSEENEGAGSSEGGSKEDPDQNPDKEPGSSSTEENPDQQKSSDNKEENEGDKNSSSEGPSTENSKAESSPSESSEVDSSSDEGSSVDGSSDEGSSVDGSSDEGSSDVGNDVYTEGTIDLTGGLKAGTKYGDDNLKVEVLADMNYKAESATFDGDLYAGFVQGASGTEPKPNNGNVPTSGSAFKITAVKPMEITFVVKDTGTKNHTFVKSDKTAIAPADDSNGANKPLSGGPHKFKMLTADTYYFYVSGSKVMVYDISWNEPQPRPAWETVADPEIETVALDEKDASKINVTVKAPIGDEGADKVTVYMYEMAEDPESSEDAGSAEAPEAIASAESVKVGETSVLSISPKKSGTYQFKAVTSREGETELKGSGLKPENGFEYEAVAAPRKWEFLAYGNGVSKPEDNAKYTVDEETGNVKLDVETGKIVPASNDGLAFYYTKVPTNKNFTFTANAHVDSWTFSNGQEGFGIMAADNVGPTGARIWNNSYQAVVSRISYKWNGVEISEDGSGESINMQIGVGSTEKVGVTPEDIDAFNANEIGQPLRFIAEQKALDTTFAKFGTGQFNICANYTNGEVTGSLGKGHVLFEDFWLQIKKDNTGYAVSYAPYVCEKDSAGDYVTDEKGRAKYILDENGNKVVDTAKITTQQYYDTDALNSLDPNNVYVGVFAARHAHILFSDMELEERDPKDDPAPKQRKKKLINLSRNVLSGNLTNTPEYTFMFASNWKGKLYVKNSAGDYLSEHYVEAEGGDYKKEEKDGVVSYVKVGEGEGDYKKQDYYDVNGTLDPEVQYCQDGDDAKDTKVRIPIEDLSIGQNVLTVEYVPAAEGTWPEVEEDQAVKLKSYDTVRFTHAVEYRKYGEEGATIYVSPKGKAGNNGTQDSPLDIYTAVKYALPGQTIILAGGRYSLNRTLEIPKTVSGEPAEGAVNEKGVMNWEKEDYKRFIKMIGDPDDVKNGKRPVLDFNSMVAAVVTVGDFWYFKDFDVIRCKDGEKGIQVSGSYSVYDRVDTYRNGSTGLQICRASGTDTYSDWPKYNTILNCNSYLNVDSGFEDADGFAAKLTSGSGNVFDGCIAAFNADDGWDLFAKAQTGSIGGVIIKNSIAYRNGYVLTKDGNPEGEISEDGICVKGAGNGNGFKMGGDGLRAGSEADEEYGTHDPNSKIPNVGHRLYNSLAFGNKSKGIDSNSAPNIKAYNCVSFNNDGANISFSTYKDYVIHTDYELKNVVSIRSKDQMAQSTVEADVQTFKEDGEADYTTKYSLNMMKAASGSSTSACVFISLKNIQDRAAKVKVWWRSSDPEKDCQIKILSEKDVLLAEGDYSKGGELKISELQTSGTEKCYLGSDDGAIKIYKVEVIGATASEPTKEQTWTADISSIYNAVGKQDLNGKKEILSNKNGAGITMQYAAIPTDGIEMLGQQNTSDEIKKKVENDKTYYYRSGNVSDGKSKNASGAGLTVDDFVSVEYPASMNDTVDPENWRNADGTINTGDFLKLKPNAGSYTEDDIPSIGGTSSMTEDQVKDLIGDEVDGSISGGIEGEVPSQDFGEDYPEDGINALDPNDPTGKEHKYYGKVWAAPVRFLDYETEEPIKYTGKKVQPEIHVYFSADPTPLVLGKDYKIKWYDNINAGTAKAEIIGVNRYKGFTTEANFTIKPISIKDVKDGGDVSVSIPSKVAVISGGDPLKEIKPTWQGKALKKDKDYVTATSGSAIVLTGQGNFAEARTVAVETAEADKMLNKASVKITTVAKDLVYKGLAVEPACEVKLNGSTLVLGTDYKVEFANNEDVGKATLTVVGMGSYFGSKSVTFSIKGGNLKDVARVIFKTGANKGNEFSVPAEVTFDGTSGSIPVNSFDVMVGETRLKKDVDYKVVQSGGNKAGGASLTIKGINNYSGALPSYKYKISPLEINDSKVEIIYDKTLDYMVGGAKHIQGQNLYIKVNGYIVDKSNYSLSYKNNKMVGGEQPTVMITGKKLLKGKLNEPLTFTINQADMTDNPDFSVSAKDVVTNGKDLTVGDLKKANVGITQLVNGKQKKLAAKRDFNKDTIEYYIDWDYDYKLSEEDMKHGALNPLDSAQKKTKVEKFDEKGYLTVFVKVKAAESGNYKGEMIGSFRVAKWSVANVKIENLKPRIFGKNWKQASGLSTPITWSDTEVAKIEDYIKITHKLDGKSEAETLKCVDIIGAYTYDTSYFNEPGFAIVPNSYKKNDRVGTASFTIIGTGKYAGTKKVTFKIVNRETAEKDGIW